MKIYITHSSSFDYQNELYNVLKNSELYSTHEFYFPHDGEVKNTKEEIKNSDVILAHVSDPSTGQGIELGWAESFGKRIIVVSKEGTQISSSVRFLTKEIFSYDNPDEMIDVLKRIL